MGCKVYQIDAYGDDDRRVQFDQMNDDEACLCTFPHNYEHDHRLDASDVRSMAMLGACVALSWHGRLPGKRGDYLTLPHDLPEWVVRELRRLVPDEESEHDDAPCPAPAPASPSPVASTETPAGTPSRSA